MGRECPCDTAQSWLSLSARVVRPRYKVFALRRLELQYYSTRLHPIRSRSDCWVRWRCTHHRECRRVGIARVDRRCSQRVGPKRAKVGRSQVCGSSPQGLGWHTSRRGSRHLATTAHHNRSQGTARVVLKSREMAVHILAQKIV